MERVQEKPAKVTVFLPRKLHRALKVRAAKADTSLSRLLAGLAQQFDKKGK